MKLTLALFLSCLPLCAQQLGPSATVTVTNVQTRPLRLMVTTTTVKAVTKAPLVFNGHTNWVVLSEETKSISSVTNSFDERFGFRRPTNSIPVRK